MKQTHKNKDQKSSHTPGPWKACRSNEGFDGPYFEAEEDDPVYPFKSIESESRTVASAHDLFEFKPENIVLMAAAPELLDCLHWAMPLVQAWHDQNIAAGNAATDTQQWLDRCKIALFDATAIPVPTQTVAVSE